MYKKGFIYVSFIFTIIASNGDYSFVMLHVAMLGLALVCLEVLTHFNEICRLSPTPNSHRTLTRTEEVERRNEICITDVKVTKIEPQEIQKNT